MPFYGLYIPPKGASISNPSSLNDPNNSTVSSFVFREKAKALEVLKQHKEARLKEFSNESDALEYAKTGYEIVQSRYNDVKSSSLSLEKAAFRAPSKQELAEFKKCIESGDYDRVRIIIWENPRYLVSSGDTPTSLKEGCRYNAMHICSLSKKTRIAELILQTVSNTEFADLLIGKKNDRKSSKELAVNLLDYYLNMPEKGRSETPLHLASKIGCVEMVELLTSYPECKITSNKDGQYPKDIICSRAPIGSSPDIVQKIKGLLEERFYVPVLRSMDAAIPPQVGQPFSPSNPPNLNTDTLSPEVKIQALAGPMNKDQALKFCRRWKTPPRSNSSASPIANSPFISPIKVRLNRTTACSPVKNGLILGSSPDLRRRSLFDTSFKNKSPDEEEYLKSGKFDPPARENGLHKSLNDIDGIQLDPEEEDKSNNNQIELPENKETNPRDLPLYPCTPLFNKKKSLFLQYRDNVVDSPIISDLLGNNSSFVAEVDFYDSPGFQERHIKITNTEKGLEMIGRQLAKEQKIDWREYWDFLDSFIDITSEEGLQQLENYFAQRKKDADLKKKCFEVAFNAVTVLDDVCAALEKIGFNKDEPTTKNGFLESKLEELAFPTFQQSTTPYTCIEKSLQVFAKRITKTITLNIENVTSINDTFLSELKRLKTLICSFKEDTRFLNVDFSKVHSRIANLVSYYLNRSQELNFSVKTKIQRILENLANLPGERREHIECVCAKIIGFFEDPISGEDLPENIKNEAMCSTTWQEELSCNCCWDANISRKTSRRHRIEERLKQMKEAEKQRKLMRELKNGPKGNFDHIRSNSLSADSSDDQEDELYWSECGSDSDEDDLFWTPLQSPSRLSLLEDTEGPYKLFIFGDEPTKRDLDVINAIFNAEIDEKKYPNIHAWKTALSHFSNEEMDFFPSPSIIKQSHWPSLKSPTTNVRKDVLRTPLFNKPFSLSRNATSTPTDSPSKSLKNPTVANNSLSKNNQSNQSPTPSQQVPFAKRLFMSPLRKTPQLTTTNPESNAANVVTNTCTETKRPLTPLNRLKGLFSHYREKIDNSPMSTSSASLGGCGDQSDSDNSLKISLINVSSAE